MFHDTQFANHPFAYILIPQSCPRIQRILTEIDR